jgi:DNA-directed RNA polymerase specialized sigma24 family protein
MGEDEDFHLLVKKVVAGSNEAAELLLARYGTRVLQAVRAGLSPRMRSKFDSLDFVQDVWAAFFANLPGEGKFDRPEQLAAFLRRIARNKVAEATRLLMGNHGGANRERSLDSSTAESRWLIAANQPTPSEEVKGHEAWEELLDSQPIVYQRILILLRSGESPANIAAELGISVRTVQRFIVKLLARQKP